MKRGILPALCRPCYCEKTAPHDGLLSLPHAACLCPPSDTLSNVSYKEVGLVDRPSPGKVAYGVMVYQRQNKTVSDVFDQFTRLFDAIYSPNFTCVVHVDIKSEPALIEKITDYVKKHAPQASTIPSVSVSWGGITVVERTLALMQAALESDPEWEYFVNIGQVSVRVSCGLLDRHEACILLWYRCVVWLL